MKRATASPSCRAGCTWWAVAPPGSSGARRRYGSGIGPDAFRRAPLPGGQRRLPLTHVQDPPRFRRRGLLLDVAERTRPHWQHPAVPRGGVRGGTGPGRRPGRAGAHRLCAHPEGRLPLRARSTAAHRGTGAARPGHPGRCVDRGDGGSGARGLPDVPWLAAFAEVAWIALPAPAERDFADFERRMTTHYRRLDALGGRLPAAHGTAAVAAATRCARTSDRGCAPERVRRRPRGGRRAGLPGNLTRHGKSRARIAEELYAAPGGDVVSKRTIPLVRGANAS